MRSMSRWSMIATSPLCSRLTSAFVRLPSRAVPRISATSTWSVRSAAAGTVATLGASCRVIARILRGFEQAFGVSPRHSVSLFGAQHPAQLIHELAAVELLDVGLRELASRPLDDAKVAPGERGHLRKVRDADHLAASPELT